MAKSPDSVQDVVMDTMRMKSLLKLTKAGDDGEEKQRLPIVIGLDTTDEGVVSVGRRGKPKALRTAMLSAVKKQNMSDKIKPAQLYFGYAYTEAGAEETLHLDLNKQPAGGPKVAMKIKMRVKSAGFTEVVFHVKEGIEDEAEEGGESAEIDAPAKPVAPPPPPEAQHTAAELQQTLAGLVRKVVAGGDPAAKAKLAGAANEINQAIKANDLAGAAKMLAALQEGETKSDSKAPADTAPTTGAAAYGKFRLAWLATHQKIHADLDKLRAQLATEFQSEPVVGQILSSYDSHIAPLQQTLDDKLAEKLEALTKATEPSAHAELLGEAKGMVEHYRGALTLPIVADLDTNPFVPLAIHKTLDATLGVLTNSLR